MSEKRVAGRVGLFAALAVIVGISLVLMFTKGASIFTPTYDLNLRTETVAGLRKGAAVMLSGVVIGSVIKADAAPEGRGVLIKVRLKDQYRIHADARFVIEQIGFLGDQYVAIYPQENKGGLITPGSTVGLEPPFSFEEIGRSARDLINEFGKSAKVLNDSLERIGRTVLSERTLTNTSAMLDNFRVVSDKAVVTMDIVNAIVQSNSVPIGIAVSNLVHFSVDLDKLAGEMRETIATNRFELGLAVKNLQTATKVLDGLARDLEAGKGLAGALVKDSGLQTNVFEIVANLTMLSSNLNKYGLLYKPKKPRPAEDQPPVYPGRNPIAP